MALRLDRCSLATVGIRETKTRRRYMAVLKIKSTHKESQGEFVLIDEENYDPKKHKLYVKETSIPTPTPAPTSAPVKPEKEEDKQ